jgi:hypothetical protein
MAIKAPPPTVSDQLRDFSDLLESGGEISDKLAAECVSYIRAGLENDGKIPLRKARGRPEATWERLNRAIRVAELMLGGMKRPDAIEKVAGENDDKPGKSTVEKDYKIFRITAVRVAHSNRAYSNWLRILAEFKALLKTFRHGDESHFSDNDVDELLRDLPASMLETYVGRINNGPLRRDESFLNEVLS